MADADRGHDEAHLSTARLALLAGLPGLALALVAAAGSSSLAVRADLILTLLDMAALAAVWWLARSPGRPSSALARELPGLLIALSMILSMTLVALSAAHRLSSGGALPDGWGTGLALALNAGYAIVNARLVRRWRAQHRQAPCPLARSQLRLFADKLTSNLLILLGLGLPLLLGESALARYSDPATGFLMAAMTAWWSAPVVLRSWRALSGACLSCRAEGFHQGQLGARRLAPAGGLP